MRHSIGFIYSTLLTVLLCVGCTAGIQQMSQAKTGASGVEQVCQQGGLTGCAALGGGFEKFALNDPTSARAHIYVMLSQNPSLDATILSQALQRYAAGAGENSRAIGQFASFLASVGREMAIVRASMIAAADAPDQSESEPVSRNAENGQSCSTDQCVYDTQCKLDRVCIAGECVSPKYAKAVESQYMKNRNLQIDPTSTVSELPPPELQLLVPPLPDDPLCTPQKVSACMTRCERGNKESCYAVAKVYENLPPA
ncbi:MAG: hypothetical protein JXX29_22225, partial [Deltaproteobacteria bacterium]|nr:hypothetical protein [Deltaproteobacteria bacterium]MBN2674414.1 hypothetical protein [Deltaproteobacteria bacterium]